MTTKIGSVVIDIEAKMTKLEANLAKVDRRLARFDKDVRTTGNSVEKSFSKIGGSIKLVAGAIAGISLARLGKDVVDTSLRFQRLDQSFLSATGSAARANQEMDYARKVANDLGLRFLDVAESYRGITAAARGTALEGQEARKMFEVTTKAGVAFGLSSDDVAGALRALTQVMSKGKVQAEELRGQLGERIFGAFQIAARGMGITTAELNKMLEEGKVISEDFLPKFIRQLESELPASVRAVDAPFNNFQNALDEIAKSTADGFMAELGEATDDLAEVLRELNNDGSMKSFGEFLGNIIRLGGGAIQLIDRLGEGIGNLFNGAKFTSLQQALGGQWNTNGRAALQSEIAEEQRRAKLLRAPGNANSPAMQKAAQAAEDRIKLLERIAVAGGHFTQKGTGQRVDIQGAYNFFKGVSPVAQGSGGISFGGGGDNDNPDPDPDGGKREKEKLSAIQQYHQSLDALNERTLEVRDSLGLTWGDDSSPLINVPKATGAVLDLDKALRDAGDAATAAINEGLGPIAERMKELDDFAQQFAATFSGAFEDAILSGDLDGALDGLLEDLARLVIRLTVIEPLARSVADAFKSGGGLGGIAKSLFGGFFADGGKPPMGKVSVVGERGPELFVPDVAGTIIPANDIGGGGIQQHFHVNAQGAVLAEGLVAEMRQIGAAAAVTGSNLSVAKIRAGVGRNRNYLRG